jgi:alpha-beta hydrolase superfamily lysophospholipase
MKENKHSIISVPAIFSLIILLASCIGMKNPDRPVPEKSEQGSFVFVSDGTKIFVYEYAPVSDFMNTIYIISGITGINHKSDKDIIELLSDNKNRVVVIHPRGTGYSEGRRGDNSDLNDFIMDYVEIIKSDTYCKESNRKIILFGHSMSSAIALKVAGKMQKIDGLILVNPPYKIKSAEGMTPGPRDYLKYIGYYIFAPHVPVVNMAGDPSLIENESDRKESTLRRNDSLLIKYFSMRYMSEAKKSMDAMVQISQRADYNLLLLYGEDDMIVDKAGCDEIFTAWKGQNKRYEIIKDGSHGKSTVMKGAEIILRWIDSL